ncbi:hypothetical protein [Saliphagus infecundisoli]|uniref:Uncharacterized protein n=1 Tax=Saliphagus infecundisoli TaxID=1849069 RepID=A0ABD5QIJ7_9EURY|nr:hypothetical protein [Saliphagus infecundisoli]
MSIQNSVSRSATAQGLETTESIDARFEAWDCEQGSVRPWALGRRKCVLSLVRFFEEEIQEGILSTPMEVTIAPTPLYQPSPSWRERIRGTYQVGVYPNANPDWGSIEAEVPTLEEALSVADRVCSDLEERYELLREGDGRENGDLTLSLRGPKPIV